jgi:hypothetical protein
MGTHEIKWDFSPGINAIEAFYRAPDGHRKRRLRHDGEIEFANQRAFTK